MSKIIIQNINLQQILDTLWSHFVFLSCTLFLELWGNFSAVHKFPNFQPRNLHTHPQQHVHGAGSHKLEMKACRKICFDLFIFKINFNDISTGVLVELLLTCFHNITTCFRVVSICLRNFRIANDPSWFLADLKNTLIANQTIMISEKLYFTLNSFKNTFLQYRRPSLFAGFVFGFFTIYRP